MSGRRGGKAVTMHKAKVIAPVAFGLLFLAATQTSANPSPLEGTISLYADIKGTDRLIENPEGTLDIYIFLDFTWPGVTAVWFSAPNPWCFDAELVGEVYYFPLVLGHAQTGVGISFGSCLTSPRILLAKLTYDGVGSLACCHYWVCAAPEAPSGHIELVTCAEDIWLGLGGALVLNTTTYPCDDSNATPCQQPVPVESSTWGKVKSLYAE